MFALIKKHPQPPNNEYGPQCSRSLTFGVLIISGLSCSLLGEGITHRPQRPRKHKHDTKYGFWCPPDLGLRKHHCVYVIFRGLDKFLKAPYRGLYRELIASLPQGFQHRMRSVKHGHLVNTEGGHPPQNNMEARIEDGSLKRGPSPLPCCIIWRSVRFQEF